MAYLFLLLWSSYLSHRGVLGWVILGNSLYPDFIPASFGKGGCVHAEGGGLWATLEAPETGSGAGGWVGFSLRPIRVLSRPSPRAQPSETSPTAKATARAG